MVVLIDGSFVVVMTSDVATAGDGSGVVGERRAIRRAFERANFRPPHFRVRVGVCSQRLIKLAEHSVLLHVGQSLHDPTDVNSLWLVVRHSFFCMPPEATCFRLKLCLNSLR